MREEKLPTTAKTRQFAVNRIDWAAHFQNLVFYLFMATMLLLFMFPFIWMLLSALKTQLQNTAWPPLFLFWPTLENFVRVYTETGFFGQFLNSLVVASLSTGFALILGLPAAYSIARYAQHRQATIILTARMMPGIGYLVPWFLLFSAAGLTGTYTGLSLTHLMVTLPLVVWIMITFYESLPEELIQAGLIDGCTAFGAFWRIALPLSKPGIASAAILAFIFSWNNFLLSLIIGGSIQTLPVAVFNFLGYTKIDWGGMNAAAVSVTLPVLLLTLLIQRHIVSGLTGGAVKQ